MNTEVPLVEFSELSNADLAGVSGGFDVIDWLCTKIIDATYDAVVAAFEEYSIMQDALYAEWVSRGCPQFDNMQTLASYGP